MVDCVCALRFRTAETSEGNLLASWTTVIHIKRRTCNWLNNAQNITLHSKKKMSCKTIMMADLGTRLPFDTAVSPATIIFSPPFSLSDLQCIGYLGAVCISMQTDL